MKNLPAKLSLLRHTIWLERAFLVLILAGLARVAWVFLVEGYLPHPFFYDLDDSFMDWYNPTYWANNRGAYDIWNTVYPPLSFVVQRILSISDCYQNHSYAVRSCDPIGPYVTGTGYLVSTVAVFFALRRQNRETALVRAGAFGLSFPMLFTLERANLLLVCFMCFVLAFGRFFKSARIKWIWLAAAVNFKPYVILYLGSQLVKRRWRWVEGAALWVVIVYIVSFALNGDGTPAQVWRGLHYYALELPDAFIFAESYYSSSLEPIVHMMSGNLPLITVLGSQTVEGVSWLAPVLVRSAEGGIALAFLAVMWKPTAVSSHRLGALTFSLLLTVTDPGGYVQMFLIFFVFFERPRGPFSIIALIAAYLLCISYDVQLYTLDHQARDVYLTGRQVEYKFGIDLGTFARPLLTLLIAYAIAGATLIDVWRAPTGRVGQRAWPTPRRQPSLADL